MNVEICLTIKAVKYLYKYIYKGRNHIAIHIDDNDDSNYIDEIKNFQSTRWNSAVEAAWRIYSFPLNEIYWFIIALQHEHKQLIKFRKSDNLNDIINNDFASRSMLTEYFHMNEINAKARTLLYKQFPEHFVWNERDKI